MPRKKKPDQLPLEPAGSLDAVRAAAQDCRRCDLWERATQTVFGAGAEHHAVMFVGEQPGDVEDQRGEPFVGPAGTLLREALTEAGFDLSDVYLTNAVKHFKWTPRGKKRLHEKPNRGEVLACRFWLEQEIAHIKPRAIVALGATAAQTVLGSSARVLRDRGKPIASPLAPLVALTVHPSSILRAPDSESRHEARKQFVADLRSIAARLRRAR